jgi:transcriptional regulator with XRE-family HTH domain
MTKDNPSRKPNDLLRYEREKRGWSQNRLAELIGADPTMISRWECGERKPSSFYQEKLCNLFGRDAIELGLVEQRKNVQSAQAATPSLVLHSLKPLSLDAEQSIEISQNHENGDDMNRREATKQIAVLISSALFMAPHDVLNPQALERLAKALIKPAHIDEKMLRDFENITKSCWNLMMDGELEIAEHTLWGYLPKLIVLANQSSQHQQITASITAQGCLLAASLAGHRNDLNARERYCEQALLYGNLARNRNLQVSALKQLALTFEYENRPGAVLQTYQKAIPYLKEVSPLLRARMYAGLAGAYSQCNQKQGGQVDEALNALGHAYESFPEKPEEDPSFLYADCDYFTIVLWDGLVHLDIDQPEAARKAFERIDGLQPKTRLPEKVRIEFLNYQAETFTRLGAMDEAHTYLEEAVKASLALGSERRYNEAHEIYKQMRIIWRNEPGIRELGDLFIR